MRDARRAGCTPERAHGGTHPRRFAQFPACRRPRAQRSPKNLYRTADRRVAELGWRGDVDAELASADRDGDAVVTGDRGDPARVERCDEDLEDARELRLPAAAEIPGGAPALDATVGPN